MRNEWRQRPMSDKQHALIDRLHTQKAVPVAGGSPQEAYLLERLLDVGGGKFVSQGEASDLIDYLFRLRPANGPEHHDAQPGYYVRGDEVFVVVQNKAKTHTYAKRLVLPVTFDGHTRGKWEYAPGVGTTLADLTPLTAQEAARLGHLHGYCVVGGEPLTDPASVLTGYGETCARNMGWPYPHTVAEKRAMGLNV